MTWAPGFIKCLQVILVHEQVWEHCHKGSIWANGTQGSPFPFLKGMFPGHGGESSPCWGPSLLSAFCPALSYKSYINGPETIWVVSSKSSDQISDCDSRGASITPPPFLSISGSARTLPLAVSQNQNTSISSHRRASMGRTLTLYSMTSVKWENMFQPLIFRWKPQFRW